MLAVVVATLVMHACSGPDEGGKHGEELEGSSDGGGLRYPAVTADEYLRERLRQIGVA